jgi:alpha-L-arabinofuranosidase
VTPTYLVNQLYAQHHGAQLLSSKVQSPTFDSSLEGKGVPYLDAIASRSEDRAQLFIKMVNTHPTRSLRTSVTVTGADIEGRAVVQTIAANSPDTANSFRAPEAISIKRTDVSAGSEFVIDLPERSVSVLTLKAR